MELSSCPQCTTRRNIPISFSFFLTNRFHLVLSCKHCNVRYVPTMLQRIVQLILMLALSICCGLLYTPALRLELALSKVGTFRLLPFWVLVLLLMLTLAHWLPLRILPWRKLESTAAFHRGRGFLRGDDGNCLPECAGSPDQRTILSQFQHPLPAHRIN